MASVNPEWEYLGITSFVQTTAGPNELGIESVRAIQTRPDPSGPNGYQYRPVHLKEEDRQCPAAGDDPGEDRPAGYRRVGVVSNYHDGAEVVGTVYATPSGNRWFWCRVEDGVEPVGDQNGFLPDWQHRETPPEQPDRGAELIGWIDESASWDAVESLINSLGESDVVEWFKADVEPEEYLDNEDGDA